MNPKLLIITLSIAAAMPPTLTTTAQNLQLHYDLRHTVAPATNPKNFPTLYFEFWKMRDSGRHRIKYGDFFLKTEADLQGRTATTATR